MISKIKSRLAQGEFFRHVLTLVMGTGFAQALPILVAPILSRQYSLEDFGLLGGFTAVTSLMGIMVGGRYELAVLLPERDEDAFHVVAVTCLVSLIVSIALQFAAFFAAWPVANALHTPRLAPWLLLAPTMVLSTGVYQGLNFWWNRKKQYRRLALNRVVRAALTVGIPVVAPFVAASLGNDRHEGGWLVIGLVAGQVITTLQFLWFTLREDRSHVQDVRWKGITRMARRYVDFPKYSVPADTLNALSNQLPVFLMLPAFGESIVGAFTFTQRVLAAPVSVIASAFADVFKQRAAEQFIQLGHCRQIWIRTFRSLSAIAVPVFGVLMLVAPWLFEVAFGPDYRQAGVFAQLLAPFFLLGFVVSPLSRTLYVAERQRQDLFWQIGLLVVIGSALWIGVSNRSSLTTIGLFSGGYCLMYALYLWMSYVYSGRPREGASSHAEV